MKIAHFSQHRWRYLTGSIVLAGIVIIYFERESVLCSMGRWLNVAGQLEEPVDAVMVLGGDFKTRPFVAVEIVRAGLARKILIPQVAMSDENRDGLLPAEQDIMLQILLQSGIASDAIVLLSSTVDSTEQEAQVAAAYLLAHPEERLAVVTSDFHTRRARRLFSRSCGRIAKNVVYIGAPTDGFDACNWWHCEAGLIAYIDEYLKLVRSMVQ